MEDLVLHASDGTRTARVDIAPHAGGRVRQITVAHGNDEAMLLARAPANAPATSTGWGMFPMVPWAGRIRHGRFDVDDTTVALDLNHSDGDGAVGGPGGGPITPPLAASPGPIQHPECHAIHGTTFARSWAIEHRADDRCELSCELTGALGWPFPGLVTQRLWLHPDHLDLELTVAALAGTRFPATVGWHPWFVKPNELDFRPTSMYERDDLGLPTGQLVDPAPPPWDDCFLNDQPVTALYERGVAPTVTVRSDCDHWVVFDEPEHATCVEPQSGPPDAPNVRPEILDPARPLTRTMSITW